MKRLFIALSLLAIVLMAAPVAADTWTLDFTVEGDAERIVLYHGPIPDGMTAQDFLGQEGLSEIQFPISSPQEFVLDYADGTQYGMFCKVFDAAGNSNYFMDEAGGNLSPTVWAFTAISDVGDAHYQEVIPSLEGNINVTVNVTVGR